MSHKQKKPFLPLNIAVHTVSDTRSEENDTSGHALVERLQAAGHNLADKKITKDDIFHIRAVVSDWIHRNDVNVVLITGGTGFTVRDNTPQAVEPLLVKKVDGFGELFRSISYQEIGTSTVQSRALAGISNGTLVVCMPGSPNACKTAWDKILLEQLDASHRPCNFVEHLQNAKHNTEQAEVNSSCETRG
ncbi:MAG TPA: molybdenum cofactor biosynthesis protein B [Oceanospirillales bacterium]|nr:molybdenum cofactor biosynthesis protein B [Oceanospirillales bacterium]